MSALPLFKHKKLKQVSFNNMQGSVSIWESFEVISKFIRLLGWVD